MQNNRIHLLILASALTLTIFILMAGLIWWLGECNFCYLEHKTTLFYYPDEMAQVFQFPGGFCIMAAKFLIQFYTVKWVGIVIMAALLTLIVRLTASLIHKISGRRAFMPLSLFPAIAVLFLHFNVNYLSRGTIALTLVLISLLLTVKYEHKFRAVSLAQRLLLAVVFTVLLYALAGAGAMLFAILLMVIKIFHSPKSGIYYVICPLMICILGYSSIVSGWLSDLPHAITPEAFFMPRLPAPQIAYLPWALMLAVILIAEATVYLPSMGRKAQIGVFVTLSLAAVIFALVGGKKYVDSSNETFKTLNCHIRNHEWDRVIEIGNKLPLNNLLHQNCVNLAMAEKGILADSLFTHPCYDIRSIYLKGESNPYFYMLLSDIYYSMGHIALAQRHAFEANESFGDTSPRMLQRLVDTNIIFGNYKVAEKYIDRLEHTLKYRDWAQGRRALLNDAAVEAHPELGAKRACIFPDDRFSGIYGLDDDLKQIIRANPDHKTTMQYLGSLYLLSKDMPRFLEVMDEFYGSDVLGTDLPQAFAEGIALATVQLGDSVTAKYTVPDEVNQRMQDFLKSPNDQPNTLWHFLRNVN